MRASVELFPHSNIRGAILGRVIFLEEKHLIMRGHVGSRLLGFQLTSWAWGGYEAPLGVFRLLLCSTDLCLLSG